MLFDKEGYFNIPELSCNLVVFHLWLLVAIQHVRRRDKAIYALRTIRTHEFLPSYVYVFFSLAFYTNLAAKKLLCFVTRTLAREP